MKKTLFIALALAASAAFAQDKPAAPAPAAATPAPAPAALAADAVIVSAGNIAITKADFEAAVKTLPAEYQQYALGPGKRQFAEDFLRMKVLASEGLKAGLDKTPKSSASSI